MSAFVVARASIQLCALGAALMLVQACGSGSSSGSPDAMGPSGTGGGSGATGSGGASGTGGLVYGGSDGGLAGQTSSGGRGGQDGGAVGGGAVDGGAGSPADAGRPDGATDATGDAGGSGYNPCPSTAGTACALLPLGDSITEGYMASGANGGYRVELFTQAVMAGKNVTFVGSLMNGPNTIPTGNRNFPKRHEGHGGYTIDSGTGHSGISGQITDSAISTYHPNIVTLLIGTNDLNGNIDTANAPTRLGKLIDEITTDAPSALVVVSTIIPTTSDGTNQSVRTYNNAIPGLVSTRAAAGKHVVLVDSYAAFMKDASFKTSLMGDNLHPNVAGYALIGQTFYAAVSAVLPVGP